MTELFSDIQWYLILTHLSWRLAWLCRTRPLVFHIVFKAWKPDMSSPSSPDILLETCCLSNVCTSTSERVNGAGEKLFTPRHRLELNLFQIFSGTPNEGQALCSGEGQGDDSFNGWPWCQELNLMRNQIYYKYVAMKLIFMNFFGVVINKWEVWMCICQANVFTNVCLPRYILIIPNTATIIVIIVISNVVCKHLIKKDHISILPTNEFHIKGNLSADGLFRWSVISHFVNKHLLSCLSCCVRMSTGSRGR